MREDADDDDNSKRPAGVNRVRSVAEGQAGPAPVGALRIRVEQAEICDDVFLVVNGQRGTGGRGIGDIGIKWRPLHGRSRNRLLIDQLWMGSLAY